MSSAAFLLVLVLFQGDAPPRPLFADLHELLPPPLASTRLVALDADGDGACDVVVADGVWGTARPVLWRNSGDGRLRTDPQAFPDGASAAGEALSAGDVDGDGDPDVILGDRLFRNDGGGRFALDPTPLEPPRPTSLLLADLDGDGDLDACGSTAAGEPGGLWLNDGGGAFTNAGGNLPHGATVQSALSAGDVELDGDLDLLACSTTSARLLANLGDAHFVEVPGALPAVVDGLRARLLDVDLDGDVDVFQLDVLLLNDGAGHFADASAQLPPHAKEGTGLLLDFDGDGDTDVVFEGLLWRNECGTFAVEAGGVPQVWPYVRAIGDFDRDGDADLIGVSWLLDDIGPGQVEIVSNQILLGDGRGTFLDASTLTRELPGLRVVTAGLLADIDRDGAVDVLLTDLYSIHSSHGDGAGRFAEPAPLATFPTSLASVPRRLGAADLDHDGDVDLLVSGRDYYEGASFDLLRKTDGVYVQEHMPAPGDEFALGDVDRDGDLDLLGGSLEHGPVVLALNDGSAHFAADPDFPPVGFQVSEVGLADFDGDGDLDAFVAATPPALVRNDGGGWSDASGALGLATARSLAAGDLDGDADADLVAVVDDRASVRTSTGGTYVEAAPLVEEGAVRARLVDVDRDGDLDALVELASGAVQAFENVDGVLVPVPWGLALAIDGTSFADVDGDGDLDALRRGELRTNLLRQIAWRTPPQLGRTLFLDVFGPPSGAWALFAAPRTARLRSSDGMWMIDPLTRVRVASGRLDVTGVGACAIAVPAEADLVGAVLHWQAVVGAPRRLTNRETTVISGF